MKQYLQRRVPGADIQFNFDDLDSSEENAEWQVLAYFPQHAAYFYSSEITKFHTLFQGCVGNIGHYNVTVPGFGRLRDDLAWIFKGLLFIGAQGLFSFRGIRLRLRLIRWVSCLSSCRRRIASSSG